MYNICVTLFNLTFKIAKLISDFGQYNKIQTTYMKINPLYLIRNNPYFLWVIYPLCIKKNSYHVISISRTIIMFYTFIQLNKLPEAEP
jgi:hypothetical protein